MSETFPGGVATSTWPGDGPRPVAEPWPGAGDPPPPRGGRRGRSRRRTILVRLLVVVLVLAVVGAGVAAGGAFFVQRKLDGNIERFGDPFAAIPQADRPAPAVKDAVNILMLGSDSRVSAGDPSRWAAGAQRTDAIMIAHIPADRSGAQVISIPRDSWVAIPGKGRNKINAAFSFGGPALMVQTVERLTRTRIDHVMIVDFEGFTEITDALGGVDITVAEATKDERGSFEAGTQHMDGATALNYVRQRKNLPGGDFDRVRRQQNWIRSVVGESMDRGTLTSPVELTSVMDALTRSLATDDDFTFGEMRSLGLSMRKVRSGEIEFLTAPVRGTGRSPDGKQSIVLLDSKQGAGLWTSLRNDTMDEWVDANGDALLGRTVR